MTDRRAGGDRQARGAQALEHGRERGVVRIDLAARRLRIPAAGELTQDDRGGARKRAGQRELREIAIELVRPLAHLFEQRDGAGER